MELSKLLAPGATVGIFFLGDEDEKKYRMLSGSVVSFDEHGIGINHNELLTYVPWTSVRRMHIDRH